MATESSSIDDLLMSVANGTPAPEPLPEDPIDDTPAPEPFKIEGDDHGEPERIETQEDAEASRNEPEQEAEGEADEYGNERDPENKQMRDRLKKQAESMERKHRAELDALRMQLAQQGASQQVQQAAKDFEYNPEASGDWQQQLEKFIEHTIDNRETKLQQAQQQQREAQVQMEFESKFRDDVQRFPDFEEAISSVGAEISDPMVYATRSMKNPAAFLYAAAKRAPAELQRIAKIQDPYAQIAAVGALEVTLRQTKPATKAPRPIGRAADDGTMPHKVEKGDSIEDLIAASEQRIRAKRSVLRR